jgi:hypothetical protein
LQEFASLDVVVVGERNQGGQIQLLFNLAALDVEGFAGREGRRPVDLCEIHDLAGGKLDAAGFALKQPGQERDPRDIPREQPQALFGIHGVAVQGNR